ncbi:DsbA family protein [Solicola gregarius]|uniref:DsbA family protein n=1 Tax=Solicola gregarius TaxID=2908642 RepID=A0AA46TJL9_9ACTN|nr:thioredoxin domain-containing protein [Solicola gregarius]UYM05678.1 DsbA family protein [Solicola gregarius]
MPGSNTDEDPTSSGSAPARSVVRRPNVLAALTVAVFAVVLGAFIVVNQVTDDDPAVAAGSAGVPEEGHVLGEPGDTGVTLVEFLDFECEACRAAFPFVEDLREKYAGEVTFVARHFPIPSHTNSTHSAAAVDAAGEQGKFEAMYKKMYDTQPVWGEQQKSNAALFRKFAEQMGLDMERYDDDVASEKILDHIAEDQQDGVGLGVEGTPTFFLNGELIQPTSTTDFTDAIDDALAEAEQQK